MASIRRRSQSLLRGMQMDLGLSFLSFSTKWAPKKPPPPGTKTRCSFQNPMISGQLYQLKGRGANPQTLRWYNLEVDELPPIIYGTAWKADATADLVRAALAAGYRAFDTANQKKHYREDFAGEALKAHPRPELFLQSKYTFQNGQDHRLPYDPVAPPAEQTRASFESSLRHFGTDYLDCYLLHGPSSSQGLTGADWEVWRTLEALHGSGKARRIGVSNIGVHHLLELCAGAKVRPHVVQNRCYAVRGWDKAVRERCFALGIAYEGFSLLTANPQVISSPPVRAAARRLEATPEQIVFRFVKAVGILPLTGTTDPVHMKQDLEAGVLALSPAEIAAIGSVR